VTRVLLLLAAGGLLASQWVWPAPLPDQLSARSAPELLELPVLPGPDGADGPARQPLWRALLEALPATPDGRGRLLALAGVHADPTRAQASAEAAGELLSLPAIAADGEDLQGSGAGPLWKAVLAGPAAERSAAGIVLRLHGCRHSGDAAAAPALEDTYAARLSIASAFRRLAAEEPGHPPLTIEGEHEPVPGGANFEVQLLGDQHMLQVTVDGSAQEALFARRTFRPDAPNDALLRAAFVSGLERLARQAPELGELRIEGLETALPEGVQVRLEHRGGTQTLTCRLPGAPALAVRRDSGPLRDLRVPLTRGASGVLLVLALLSGRRPRAAGSALSG
jgi:hypothetical protein